MNIHLTINGETHSHHDVEPRLAVQADGSNVTPIEWLAVDGIGLCTPGMIMASKQILDRDPHPTDEGTATDVQQAAAQVYAARAILAALRTV